jgi:predicted dehydrogenase
MPEDSELSRRDFVKAAGVVSAAAGPYIQTIRAANEQVRYGFVGTGGRGQYLLGHFKNSDLGRCLAVCDVYEPNLRKGAEVAGTKPATYKDYRELLTRSDIDAVAIATPLYMHFPVIRDALLAGKHVFCEKSLVFKAEEIHELRAICAARPKLIVQVGLQRRYSKYYQTARQMIEKGVLGEVTHVQAQWHRNPGWTMVPDPDPLRQRQANWRLYREYSGGLTAELASHQVDIADWMFGMHPEMVVGVGGLDYRKDGREVYDHIQLIYSYPRGRRLTYSAISTNRHLAQFGAARNEFGEIIMGTEGTIEITVGGDSQPALGLWYYEPGPRSGPAASKEKPVVAGASLLSVGAGSRALPILLEKDQVSDKDSFVQRELKFARQWLYSKGIMTPEDDRNPVDVELESFLECVRTGARPLADLEVGLADSAAVILANLAMDEGRRVQFSEIDKMGRGSSRKPEARSPKPEAKPQNAQD